MVMRDNGGTKVNAQSSLKTFTCPSCDGTVEMRALGLTVTVFCKHCGAEIDVVNENHKVLSTAQQKGKVIPAIRLGTHGTLFGVDWEVIGFMQRSDASFHWYWNEYLLFNPKQGFRWLTENQGHWTSYVSTRQQAEKTYLGTGRRAARLANRRYYLFDQGTAVVRYVIGEFYWRVKKGERVETEDYIAPPRILSHETTRGGGKSESIWSVGEYIAAETIQEIFDVRNMPIQVGIGPAQPNIAKNYAIEFSLYAIVFTVVLLAITAMASITNRERLLLSTSFDDKDYFKTRVTESFDVTQNNSALSFAMDANVNQSWASLSLELVNDETGEVRNLEEGVEFWSGRDSDGYWSEGSSHSEKKITPVKQGRYHINADYAFQNSVSYPVTSSYGVNSTLRVSEVGHGWGNFWLAEFMLWLVPVLFMCWAYHIETTRWSNSDYSPFDSE